MSYVLSYSTVLRPTSSTWYSYGSQLGFLQPHFDMVFSWVEVKKIDDAIPAKLHHPQKKGQVRINTHTHLCEVCMYI